MNLSRKRSELENIADNCVVQVGSCVPGYLGNCGERHRHTNWPQQETQKKWVTGDCEFVHEGDRVSTGQPRKRLWFLQFQCLRHAIKLLSVDVVVLKLVSLILQDSTSWSRGWLKLTMRCWLLRRNSKNHFGLPWRWHRQNHQWVLPLVLKILWFSRFYSCTHMKERLWFFFFFLPKHVYLFRSTCAMCFCFHRKCLPQNNFRHNWEIRIWATLRIRYLCDNSWFLADLDCF